MYTLKMDRNAWFASIHLCPCHIINFALFSSLSKLGGVGVEDGHIWWVEPLEFEPGAPKLLILATKKIHFFVA
jgi:hypothetical protein